MYFLKFIFCPRTSPRLKSVTLQSFRKRETAPIYIVWSYCSWTWRTGSCTARTSNHSVSTACLVAILSQFAATTAMASLLLVGQIHTQLPSPRRHDCCPKGWCRRHYDYHGTACNLCIYSNRLDSPHNSSNCRCRRRPCCNICRTKRQTRRH